MVAVLVVGLICGGLARRYARLLRRQDLIAQLHLQQQVTDSVIREMHGDIAAAGRKGFSYWTGDSFGLDDWATQINADDGPDGRRIPLIFVAVSGGCDEDILRPITIETAGASLEKPLIDRLIRAYRARGWRHEVVPLPAVDEEG
jgi:hypothetical protein